MLDSEANIGNNVSKAELYKNPDFTTLYRFENPGIPYDEKREGIVSQKGIIGAWFTDDLSALKTYTLTRIKGVRGGRFIVVRVRTDDLHKYDATKMAEIRNMDIEKGNFIVPPDVAKESRVEINGIFKDTWERRRNIPVGDWDEVGAYINANLSNEAIITKLEKNHYDD